ncbi:hypothetical protein [Methylobacterium planeticum]|nr:hypothetical protein [Methylobacterium planeticum]
MAGLQRRAEANEPPPRGDASRSGDATIGGRIDLDALIMVIEGGP